MPNFTAGTSFTDGVTNDVTAAKLNALVADAVPTSSLALNSTTGTIATFNSTTGTIPTLVATTLITTGTGTAAAPAIVPTGDANTGIFFPAADTIAFSEGGAEAVRIDSSGNVGIGNASPASVLDMSKASDTSERTIKIQNSSSDLYVGTEGTSGNRFSGSSVNNVFFGTTGADGIEFATNNTVRTIIDSSGNVGIGIASPSGPLHIRGAAGRYAFPATSGATQSNGLTLRLNDASDDNAILDIGGNSTSGYWLQATNNANLATNYPLLLNPNGGNVGIGTNSPSTPSGKCITIYDSSIPRLNLKNSTSGDTSTDGVELLLNGSDAFLNNRENGSVGIGTNNATRLFVDSSGNCSIGTATALSKLHIHGDLTLSNATTAVTASTSTITPPATVAGYLTVSINGTSRKIAYYAT